MLFSVVIPLYNKSYSIERCINSVLSQSYEKFEVIIVNDGSTDDSEQTVINSYPNEIALGKIRFISQPNKGVSVARNNGVVASNYEYICFLDADDEWKEDFLINIKSLIHDFPSACLYCLQHETKLGEQKPVRNTSFYKNGFRGYVNNFFKASLFGSIANSSKICVKREAFMATGGFPENEKSGEDLYIWIELQKLGSTAFFNQLGVTIHISLDASRKGRNLSIPYPLTHYSKKENRKEINFWLKLYLRKIFLSHIVSSFKDSDYEAVLIRAKASEEIFPISSTISSIIAKYKKNHI